MEEFMPDDMPRTDAVHDVVRLLALNATALLDSGPEASFDRYTRLASRLLGVPVSLVSLVDRDRQFFKSQVGLPEPWASRRQTPLSHSFCRHVVDRAGPLVVGDARRDPLVCDNGAIRDLNVVAYLGVPLTTRQGLVLGSFCAIDVEPREWTDEQVATMSDLAAAVMTEIELRSLSSDFLAAFRRLQELENERDEMVQMLVHDLRNPLSSLLAGLDMLEIGEGLADKQRRYVDRAREGGHSLLRMINDILTVSRGEAGKLDVELKPVEPLTVTREALDQLSHLAVMSGIEVTVDMAETLPAVSGDAGKLRRVLVNLIANAIDHTPAGGRIVVAAREIGDDVVRFSVADTGSGLPPESRERIFNKFEQARVEGERRERSSGLGLPFCKTVVEAHGGRIWVESRPGEGACFYFTIPFGLR